MHVQVTKFTSSRSPSNHGTAEYILVKNIQQHSWGPCGLQERARKESGRSQAGGLERAHKLLIFIAYAVLPAFLVTTSVNASLTM
jgi:hypothetical protein